MRRVFDRQRKGLVRKAGLVVSVMICVSGGVQMSPALAVGAVAALAAEKAEENKVRLSRYQNDEGVVIFEASCKDSSRPCTIEMAEVCRQYRHLGDRCERIHADEVIQVIGGSADDRLSCAGLSHGCVIHGNDGNDLIAGGAGNDEIRGGEGNDVVRGDEGRDRLFGNTGDDQIIGDGGDDRIFGGSGNDRLHGGDGDDIMKGEGGDDILYGDRGDDRLDGGPGLDEGYGGEGVDRMYRIEVAAEAAEAIDLAADQECLDESACSL